MINTLERKIYNKFNELINTKTSHPKNIALSILSILNNCLNYNLKERITYKKIEILDLKTIRFEYKFKNGDTYIDTYKTDYLPFCYYLINMVNTIMELR